MQAEEVQAAQGIGVKPLILKDLKEGVLAPQVGFEPTTLRLTAERLIGSSYCKHKT